MIKLDLSKSFKELDGKDLCDDVAGKVPILMNKVLAHRLSVEPKPFDALKFWDWAQSLFTKSAIEVDGSDFKKLRTFIDENASLQVILKAQLLLAFDEAEKFSLDKK